LILAAVLQFTNAQELVISSSFVQMKELGFNETLILGKTSASEVNFDFSIKQYTRKHIKKQFNLIMFVILKFKKIL
tara:strand:- start:290 stop:517 length:228 start_codon:yes stop_codon:yes gene_type:complete